MIAALEEQDMASSEASLSEVVSGMLHDISVNALCAWQMATVKTELVEARGVNARSTPEGCHIEIVIKDGTVNDTTLRLLQCTPGDDQGCRGCAGADGRG